MEAFYKCRFRPASDTVCDFTCTIQSLNAQYYETHTDGIREAEIKRQVKYNEVDFIDSMIIEAEYNNEIKTPDRKLCREIINGQIKRVAKDIFQDLEVTRPMLVEFKDKLDLK